MLSEPTPMAGNQGTTITVSDLFYNVPTRLKGLANTSEEYAKIVKVIQRYAIQLAGRVGLSVKKAGIGSGSDVQTSVSLAPTPKDVIRSVFGGPIAKGLVSLDALFEERLEVHLSGCVSAPTFHQKSITFVLFINGRLVDSAHIKKCVMALYSQLLPKGTYPFAYLSLTMPPRNVDVNVHPTKSEVFFLHEQQVLEFIDRCIREAIQSTPIAMESLPVPVQSLTQTKLSTSQKYENEVSLAISCTPPSSLQQAKKLYPFQMVHSDPKTRTMDRFIVKAPKKPRIEDGQEMTHLKSKDSNSTDLAKVVEISTRPTLTRKSALKEKEISEDPRELTSVKTLIDGILTSRHERLTESIKNSVIVGIFDSERMLLQHQSQLLMIEHLRFAVEMLYQKCLLGLGYHECWKLPSGIGIAEILSAHVAAYYPEHDEAQVQEMIELINSQSEMLLEYFSIQIADGHLIALPRLLEGLESPTTDILAEFLFRLALETEWFEEEACFHSIAHLLSRIFSALVSSQSRQEEYLRHYLYPALKGSDMSKFGHIVGYDRELVKSGAITELTNTHELYKIFERC